MPKTVDALVANAEQVITNLSNATGTLNAISKPTRVDNDRNITTADQSRKNNTSIDDTYLNKRYAAYMYHTAVVANNVHVEELADPELHENGHNQAISHVTNQSAILDLYGEISVGSDTNVESFLNTHQENTTNDKKRNKSVKIIYAIKNSSIPWSITTTPSSMY